MATPKSGYYIDGKRVPSVTTIIGTGLGGYSRDALMHWSWKLGMEGVDYRERRDKAATAGTAAHSMIENFLAGRNPGQGVETEDQETAENAERAFKAFRGWEREHRVEVLRQEVQLTDDEFGFGGCYDALIELDGVLTLADWKSSSDIYGSMVAQIGAYHRLITVNHSERNHPKQAVIVKAGKDGTLRVVELDSEAIALGWDVFQAALKVYNARRVLDGLVAKPLIPGEAKAVISLPTVGRKVSA